MQLFVFLAVKLLRHVPAVWKVDCFDTWGGLLRHVPAVWKVDCFDTCLLCGRWIASTRACCVEGGTHSASAA